MNPRQRIAAILKQWIELTEAESLAIQSGDWTALRSVQAAKAGLRPSLAQSLEQWRAQDPSDAKSNPFQAEIDQVLALDTRNGNYLAARLHRAREKKKLLEQALFNLRRVRASYAQPAQPVLDMAGQDSRN